MSHKRKNEQLYKDCDLYKKSHLYRVVFDKCVEFKDEAKKHKKLSRSLWWISAIISLIVAVFNNLDFNIFKQIDSKDISSVLALIIPMVTAYIVFRTPQKLWINEIFTRNKLLNIKEKIELGHRRNTNFDKKPLEEEYFHSLKQANEIWAAIKQSTT